MCSAASFLVLILSPRESTSQSKEPTPGARLVYEVAAGVAECPDEGALTELLRGRLGPELVDPSARSVLRIAVAPRAGAPRDIEGHIEWVDPQGRRTWATDLRAASGDCGTLVSSLALSLQAAAVTLERPRSGPLAPGGSPGDRPVVLRGVSLDPPALYGPGQAAAYSSPAPTPWASFVAPSIRLQGSAGPVFGAAPSVPVRIAAGMGFLWPWVSVSIEARATLPAKGRIRIYDLSVARWDGVFLPCVGTGVFFGCALFAAGGLWAETVGARKEVRALFHASAGARAGVELTLTSNLAVAGFVDFEGSLLPADIRIDNFAAWQETAGQVALGLSLSWGTPTVHE